MSEDTRAVLNGREFILRELATSLSHGTLEEISFAGGYIHSQSENLTPEMMPSLQRDIGAGGQRWAAILVNLMDQYHPSIKDLRAGVWRDVNWNPSADHGYSLATAILKKLPDSPESDRFVIDAIIARASFAPEAATFLANEYAPNSYLSSSLRTALNRLQAGSIYLAWTLIDQGHISLLPYAVKAAQDLAKTSEEANLTDAQRLDANAAASLLRR